MNWNQNLEWWVLFVVAGVAWLLGLIVGGVIGDFVNLFAVIMVALGAVNGLSVLTGSKK